MTPRRRQGPGRAAFDHISQQLTESLSTLSKITAGQAAIAEAARGDQTALTKILERLDDDLLGAVAWCASLVAGTANDLRTDRQRERLADVRVPFAVCTCNHGAEEHPRGGHCQGIDSYSQQCSCESFERDTSDDPDEESP